MKFARRTGGSWGPTGTTARWAGSVAIALVLGSAGPASAQPPQTPPCNDHVPQNDVPQNATWSDTYIESSDGAPRLHADVFRPKGLSADDKTPVILLVAPYVGNESVSDALAVPAVCEGAMRPWHRPFFTRALEHGYTVVQVALRGFGASGGCGDFMGAGEQADAARAIRWAADQSWSTGRVATYGGSAEAWPQVAALTQRVPGHDAAVILAPFVDGYRWGYMNRVPYGALGSATTVTPLYGEYGLLPAPLASSPEEHAEAGVGAAGQPGCTAQSFQGSLDPDPASDFWRERELSSRLAGVRVPVLLQAGTLDPKARPDQFPLLWGALDGPKRLWLTQDDHQMPTAWKARTGRGAPEFTEQVLRWLDRYVKGVPESQAAVNQDPPVEVQEGYAGAWRAERQWPPPDARPVKMPVLPGSYQDAPGNKAEQGKGPGGTCIPFEVHFRCDPTGVTGQGSWTFTRPFADGAHIAGAPRLRVSLRTGEPAVNLIALLYDIDANNQAALISRGAYLVRGGSEAEFELFAQDWKLEPGHRLGVLLSGSDGLYFRPRHSGARVEVRGGSLAVPLLTDQRSAPLPTSREGSALIQTRTTFPVDPADISGREVAVQRSGTR